MSNKIIFIVGPTAVGKSAVANKLAQRLDMPIVACDSAQVYTEINIASNKSSMEIRKQIPHHLLDVVSVAECYDVSQYCQMTNKVIEEITSRGKSPLVVGGTGLYMKILLDGMSQVGSADQAYRDKLWTRVEQNGSSCLHDELAKFDPQAAQRIHPNDAKKIIRALEVYELTGKSSAKKSTSSGGIWDQYEVKLFALNRPREIIYARINERVDQMFQEGLLEEVEFVRDVGLSQTASMVIGVKEVLPYLKGEYDLERAKYLMKLNTRHYAKRQMTWYNKENRLQWIDMDQYDSDNDIVEYLIEEIS